MKSEFTISLLNTKRTDGYRPCQWCLHSHSLFHRLFCRLCLLLAPSATWPWTTNRQTPRHRVLWGGNACIAHCPLLPVQDGGVRAAERATLLAQEGWCLAPRRPGGVQVQRQLSYPTPAAAQRKDHYVLDSDSEVGRPRRRRRRSQQVTLIKNAKL